MQTKVELTLGQDIAVDLTCIHNLTDATVMFRGDNGECIDVCMPVALWRAALDAISEELGAEREKIRAQMARSEL